MRAAMKIRRHLIIAITICMTILCIASNDFALDLSEALQRAKRYDTTYQAAYASYLAASETSNQSVAAILPQIKINGFVQRGNTRTTVNGSGIDSGTSSTHNNNYGYTLNLNQVIYNKALFDKLDQGDATVAKAKADLAIAQQDLILRVATAYFKVLSTMATLETARAEKKAIGKQLEQSKERYKVGHSAITDVYDQQARYDIAAANVIITTNTLSNAREALGIIINKYTTSLDNVKPILPIVAPQPCDINVWQDKALANNYSIKAAQYAVKAAESDYDASKGGHYPTLSLNTSYGYIDSAPRNFAGRPFPGNQSTDAKVMLTLSIPVYSGGLTSSIIRQKAAELGKARALLDKSERITAAQARSAFLTVKSDIATVKARYQAVVSTHTSLDATIAGYDAGTRTSVDVLLAQRLVYSSQREFSSSRYTYIIDSLKLKQVVGILSDADVAQINHWLIPKPAGDNKGVVSNVKSPSFHGILVSSKQSAGHWKGIEHSEIQKYGNTGIGQ